MSGGHFERFGTYNGHESTEEFVCFVDPLENFDVGIARQSASKSHSARYADKVHFIQDASQAPLIHGPSKK